MRPIPILTPCLSLLFDPTLVKLVALDIADAEARLLALAKLLALAIEDVDWRRWHGQL